ncbi:MAG: hypothetical protein IPP83_13315 [Flavobacteriales bacterium]|nr:hypothetical protein [Flavobacteriales bacterium]
MQPGRFSPLPYDLYSLKLPVDEPPSVYDLRTVVWLELYDPMFLYTPPFHCKGCEPRTHPLTGKVGAVLLFGRPV